MVVESTLVFSRTVSISKLFNFFGVLSVAVRGFSRSSLIMELSSMMGRSGGDVDPWSGVWSFKECSSELLL